MPRRTPGQLPYGRSPGAAHDRGDSGEGKVAGRLRRLSLEAMVEADRRMMRRRREGAPRTSDESKAPCLRRGNPGKGSAKPRRDRSRMRRRLKLRLQHSLGKLGALTD